MPFRLVEELRDALVIIIDEAPLLHELDCSLVGQVSRATLRPVIHDVHLKTGFVRVTHHDGQ